MSALPTIHDVARVAGVSRQTVSNVLNSPGIVRPNTRERVVSAIAELGYRPHESARRLRTRKSSTIGIRIDPMTDGISGSVLDRFLHALTEQAAALGLRVMLFTATDPDDEIRQFARLRDGADVDAFVLTSTFHGDPRTEWLIANDQSFVTFGRPWGIDDMSDPEHLWVDVDGWSGLHEATLALLDAAAGQLATPGAGSRPSRDHSPTSPTVHPVPAGERVGYIGWPSGSGTGDDRRRGWRDAMHERSGLDPAGIDALARGVEDGVSSGGEALRSLLRAPGGVDAVVCASDSLALGALIAGGSRIPVIGYDNTPVAAALGLSSVEQPLDEVAAGVLELLTGTHRGRVDAPRAAAPASAGPQAPSDDPRHRLVRPRLILRTPESIPTP